MKLLVAIERNQHFVHSELVEVSLTEVAPCDHQLVPF